MLLEDFVVFICNRENVTDSNTTKASLSLPKTVWLLKFSRENCVGIKNRYLMKFTGVKKLKPQTTKRLTTKPLNLKGLVAAIPLFYLPPIYMGIKTWILIPSQVTNISVEGKC